MKIHVAYSAFERRDVNEVIESYKQNSLTGKCLEHERACSLLSGRADPLRMTSFPGASLPEKFCLYIFTIGKIVQSLCKVLGMAAEVGGNRGETGRRDLRRRNV